MGFNKRIVLISFWAMWFVVIWHSYCGSSIERWFLPVFCYWTVPWFFCVSGYFLFHSFDKRGAYGFLLEKIRALVFPYFLWCIIGTIVYMLLSPHPVELSVVDIFALRNEISPAYNRPLWYVRALVIFLVIGWVILVALKRLRVEDALIRLIVFCALFCMIVGGCIKLGLHIGPGSSSLYFLLGVCMSSARGVFRKVDVWINARYSSVLLFTTTVLAIACRGLWFYSGHSFSNNGQGGIFFGNLSTIFMIVTIILIVNMLDEICISKAVGFWGAMTSFIYFSHRPLLTCIISHLEAWLPQCSVVRNIEFIALSLLYVPFSILVGVAVKHYTPKIYYILTGGRG